MVVPVAVAILAASTLVCMPPRDSSEAALPAIASISAVTLSTSGRNVGVRVGRRRGRVEAVDVGQEDEQVGAHHGGDAGGEAVVVAVADLVGGDGVVLVDDRDRAELQQRGDGRAGVEVAAALLGVAEGEQDLPGGEAVALQRLRLGAGERDLADRGGGLALLEPSGAGRQVEDAAAEGDGAGGDDEQVAPPGGKRGQVGGRAHRASRA